MKRIIFNGYKFKYDRKGIYPADSNFNFADEACRQAIQEAVAFHQKPTVPGFVYLAAKPQQGVYKIGKSVNVKQRLYDQGLSLLHAIECPDGKEAFKLETFFHCYFGHLVYEGDVESFYLTDDNIKWFMSFSKSEEVPRQLPPGAVSPKSQYHPRHKRERVLIPFSSTRIRPFGSVVSDDDED